MKIRLLFLSTFFSAYFFYAQLGPNDDFDGDGIVNNIDLDDDNDGILDTQEGLQCGLNILDMTGLTDANSKTISYIDADGYFNTATIDFTSNSGSDSSYGTSNGGVRFVGGSSVSINLTRANNLLVFNDASTPANFDANDHFSISTNGSSTWSVSDPNNDLQINSNTGGVLDFTVLGSDYLYGQMPYQLTATGSSYQFELVWGNPASNLNLKIEGCQYQDTDGDGFPDHLDTDADNDGCADALEGGAGLATSDLVNDQITGGVDANGVPTLVGGGQSAGTSTDVTQISTVCQPASPWVCEATFYQLYNGTSIVTLNTATGTYDNYATLTGATSMDNVALNPTDSKVYGIASIGGSTYLANLSPDGSVQNLNLEISGSYAGAAITNSGILYLVSDTGQIDTIDLNSTPYTIVNTGVYVTSNSDLVYDVSTDRIYALDSAGTLYTLNPTDNSLTTSSLTGAITSESSEFGALWSSGNGAIFAYNNTSGKIYSINTADHTTFEILNSTSNLTNNDGFNCPSAQTPLENNATDGIDNDGDGLVDCNDPDSDLNPDCIAEICDNGIDDDGDGFIDCADGDCYNIVATCIEICDNGIDDDGDGLIDSADPDCTASASVDGGLESNRRLSSLISERNYQIAKQKSKEYIRKKNGAIPYKSIQLKNNDFSIVELIPNSLENMVVTEGTPMDLTSISNAVEVVATDYYQNNTRVASVLGITSENEVYEHTKYICDRLDGAKLMDVSYLNFGEGNLIMYELLTPENRREFATTIAVYQENGAFYAENHWNTYQYSEKPIWYNVQVWANSPSLLIQMVQEVMNRVRAEAPIVSAINSYAPRTFISYGRYKNGELILSIKNKARVSSIQLEGNLKRTENSDLENFNYTTSLNGQREQTIVIPTGYLYDFGFSMMSEGNANDEVFLSDGTWMPDTSHNGVEVLNYTLGAHDNNENISEEDAYILERSMATQAEVTSYFNISRSLTPKYSAVDVSQYQHLAFTASGNGLLEITLVKESIDNWTEQFKTRITLQSSDTQYSFSVNDLESTMYEELLMDDVVMVVFTLVGDGINRESRQLQIANLRFTNADNLGTEDIQDTPYSNELTLYPNPAVHEIHLTSEQEIVSAEVYSAEGQFISTEKFAANTFHALIALNRYKPGVYFIRVRYKDQSEEVKKFIKL